MKTVIVFLADGMEMSEALLTVDILRRAGIDVITASVHPDWFEDELEGHDEDYRMRTFEELRKVTSSHKVTILADESADELIDNDVFRLADAIVLPGGRIGTDNLAKSGIVKNQILAFAEEGKAEDGEEPAKYIAAICAAPSVLAELGLLENKVVTCHPDFEEKLTSNGAIVNHESVAVTGNIITGQALGATIDFVLELVKKLSGEEVADRVRKNICYK